MLNKGIRILVHPVIKRKSYVFSNNPDTELHIVRNWFDLKETTIVYLSKTKSLTWKNSIIRILMA